jgi:hypothetical protein
LLLGGFILHERLSVGDVAGMLLIFAGLVVIDGRLLRRALQGDSRSERTLQQR